LVLNEKGKENISSISPSRSTPWHEYERWHDICSFVGSEM